MSIKKQLVSYYNKFFGWKTDQKILVIESDDWGNLGMPDKAAQQYLLNRIPACKNNPYILFDTLESPKDLACLSETLLKFKDRSGNHPVFTANTVVANPDFERIAASNFSEYFFEPITSTFNRYFPNGQLLQGYREGIDTNVFFPQFHGREHLNYARWMHYLQQGNPMVKEMFFKKVFDLSTSDVGIGDLRFSDALNFFDKAHLENQPNDLKEGLTIFKELFNYASETFIAPVYTWHSSIEQTLANEGVSVLQGGAIQKVPTGDANKRKNVFHYLGQRNRHGQIYLVRNSFFEPSVFNQTPSNAVDTCLFKINQAFESRMPAIICSHRINFVSGLDPTRYKANLEALKSLLHQVLNKWPDVIFMNSASLGIEIRSSK